MRRMRAGAAATAGVVLVGTLAGCGGDGGSGTGPGTFDVRTVRALPDRAAEARTFSFEMTKAYLIGTDGDLEVGYRGSVDVAAHQAAIEADVTDFVAEILFPMSQIGAESEDADGPPDEVIVPMVADGEVAYAEVGVISDLAPEGQRRPDDPRWVRYGPDHVGDGGSSFTGLMTTADPEAILALLAAATGDVETVGDEDVRGEPATHLRARVDLATAREQAPEDHRAMIDDLAGEGDAQVDEVPVDVWVGEDGLLRRFAVEIERDGTVTTDSPGGPPLPSDAAGALTTLAYEAFDYGEPVEIEIPAADDVVDAPESEATGATGTTGSNDGEPGDSPTATSSEGSIPSRTATARPAPPPGPQ